jgi:hypothetical protein
MTSHTIPPRWVPLGFSFRSVANVPKVFLSACLCIQLYRVRYHCKQDLVPGRRVPVGTNCIAEKTRTVVAHLDQRCAETANLERPNIGAGLTAKL